MTGGWGTAATLGLTGASALGGALGNRGGKSTSTTTPILTPEQQAIEGELAQRIRERLANPDAGLAPIRSAGKQRIRRTYSVLPQQLAERFAARGMGESGKLIEGNLQLALSEAGDLAGFENELASEILRRDDYTLSLAERFAQPRGSTTTQTGGGNRLGGAVNTGLQTLTTLLTLDRLLRGNSAAAGSGGNALNNYGGPSNSILFNNPFG